MPSQALSLLALAIIFEIIATNALKLSEGFTRLAPSLVVVLGYGMAFYLFSLSLRAIPLGTAYAIWAGVGTAGTAVIGVWLWQESLDPLRIFGLILIVGGVVILNVGGGH